MHNWKTRLVSVKIFIWKDGRSSISSRDIQVLCNGLLQLIFLCSDNFLHNLPFFQHHESRHCFHIIFLRDRLQQYQKTWILITQISTGYKYWSQHTLESPRLSEMKLVYCWCLIHLTLSSSTSTLRKMPDGMLLANSAK